MGLNLLRSRRAWNWATHEKDGGKVLQIECQGLIPGLEGCVVLYGTVVYIAARFEIDIEKPFYIS